MQNQHAKKLCNSYHNRYKEFTGISVTLASGQEDVVTQRISRNNKIQILAWYLLRGEGNSCIQIYRKSHFQRTAHCMVLIEKLKLLRLFLTCIYFIYCRLLIKFTFTHEKTTSSFYWIFLNFERHAFSCDGAVARLHEKISSFITA